MLTISIAKDRKNQSFGLAAKNISTCVFKSEARARWSLRLVSTI